MEAVQFLTFQQFGDKSLALELTALLDKNQIPYQFSDDSPVLDAAIGGGELSKEYSVSIKKADFEKVDHLLTEASVNDIDTIDKDYYLFAFSDDELREVIAANDEWSKFDYLLAQKLLSDRGHQISAEELKALKQQRIDELSKPEKKQTEGVVSGYILSVLGGFFGIVIGWYLHTHKKTLPNGDRVYAYLESDRRHGKRIMVLGIVMVLIAVSLKFFGTEFLKTLRD